MANLAESSIWEAGVYQIEENDPVHGGANGITNRPAKQLANRTVWLKNELASSVQAINANLTSLSTNKADKTLNLVAGNGLTGGGTLQANRTLTLGTPSQITASTTNSVTATSHTHAIDKASTTTQGIVQLNDTLVSTATDQALTANQGKVLNDKITATDAKADTKANQATAITAGNGLTGGGTLQASRTLTLGTPSQITASTTNSVTATSHTHAIDKASTTTQGIVQLVDNLITDDATKALTANQGKVLNDKIDNKDSLKTINYLSDQSSNYELTGFYRGNAMMMGSDVLPAMEMHIAHPTSAGNGNARGIGFAYGPSFDLTTTAWDGQGTYLGQKTILTELNGVMLSDKSNSIELNDVGKVATSRAVYTLNQAKLDKTANAVSASKLATARTINGVAFDGTTNITITDDTKLSLCNALGATNLDQLIASESYTGVWWQVANNNATTARNYPMPMAGTLLVLPSAYMGQQIYIPFGGSVIFTRSTLSDGSWSGWKAVGGVIDTLASTATDQALTANQGKVLNDKITATDAKADTKANQATTITAGNGLTGGGTLQANRTITLGTPSQITASTTNSVTATSHTHAIDKASTTTQGIVQLVDNLITDDATKALTANQGKVLQDGKVDKGYLPSSTDVNNIRDDGIYALGSGGTNLPSAGAYKMMVLSGAQTGWPHQIAVKAYNNEMYIRSVTGANSNTWTAWQRLDRPDWGNIDNKPSNLAYTSSNVASATKLQTARTINGVAFDGTQNITIYDNTKLASNANAVSASRLATARTISLTGAVTGLVSFDGSANVSIATTMQQGLGVGQTWQDVTASRSSGVTYTNSTGKPIFVRAISIGGNKNLAGYVNGVVVDRHVDTYNSGTPETNIGFIVPHGANYRIDHYTSGVTILELR